MDALSAGRLLSGELETEWKNREDLYVEAQVMLSDGTVLTDVDTLVPYKYIELEKPQFRVSVSEEEDCFTLTITSDVFAPFVELDFDDADVIFSDNFFVISNEKPVEITLKKEDIRNGCFADAEDVRKRLRLTTVADTY